jgi:uncharacterized membrane protein YcaP (DUF421 family)
MKKEEIYLSDWQRILLGNTPFAFMLEVALRTLIIYLALVIIMRLLGKRMNAQLSITELAVMIMLGGIVSVPMQIPERGLLHGFIVLGCVLFLHRGINWLAFRYRKAEIITQGDLQVLVKEGVLDSAEMAKASLSREQLFANLRAQNIQHLGQIKRVYLEADGHFSIYRQASSKPGLSVLPEKDTELQQTKPQADGLLACVQCGNLEPKQKTAVTACTRCGGGDWTYVVK